MHIQNKQQESRMINKKMTKTEQVEFLIGKLKEVNRILYGQIEVAEIDIVDNKVWSDSDQDFLELNKEARIMALDNLDTLKILNRKINEVLWNL
jgi:hypothetical protein